MCARTGGTDERSPALQPMYQGIAVSELPLAKSLKDTIARVTPYYERHIRRDIEAGRRALVMYLDHIPENKITELNISTGAPLVYGLDEGLSAVRHRYLGDAAAMQAKMQAVKNQGTKRRCASRAKRRKTMYCTRKLTDAITWVGGSDRRLALFENLFPVPRGGAYNSYLIMDEKTELIDTVNLSAPPASFWKIFYMSYGAAGWITW